ncbi:MAG: hypothetical protein PVG07_16725 [Acidobacteriota bacterium]|jgi:hypothetical protein
MPTRTFAAALLPLLSLPFLVPTGGPLRADEVHLTNGETFEGVIAEVQGDRVAIRLPNGVIRLPSSRVARVERSASPFEEYLVRAEDLAGSTDPGAWLDLALWARARELGAGMRQAALEAARLDPDLEGLEPVMKELGFARDDELGGWIPFDELMTRRGYVEVDGRWVSAEVVAEAARRARAEHERAMAERRSERIDQVIDLLALAQLQEAQEEQERRRQPPPSPYGSQVGATVGYAPGGFVPRGHHPRSRSGHPGRTGKRGGGHVPPPAIARGAGGSNTASWSDVARHQPGSIIPISPAPAPSPPSGKMSGRSGQ